MPGPTRRRQPAEAPVPAAPAPPPVEEGIPLNEKTYTKLHTVWPRAPLIEVEIQGAPPAQDVRIPLAFIETSGDNTWNLVHRMVSTLVNEPGQLWNSAETLVDLNAQSEAGLYLFAPIEGDGNGASFSWRQGPTGFRKGQATTEHESEERSSISAASTDQTRFRDLILGRDRTCLLSAADSSHSQAAHIVPKRRTDVYAQLLDVVEANAYECCMGIFLSRNLRHAYDNWQWSLYYKNGSYFVHVFYPDRIVPVAEYHGMDISGNFHQRAPASELPDPRLCNWHWEQCVLMRLRGFSSGLAVNAL